jgi:16S rRNA (adenine1518-N6/adenine1519-N6)-dimethyltransferase
MKSYAHAKKRFGQNFLRDAHVVEQIVNTLALQPDDNVVEIGPGHGALTRALVPRLNHLHAVELDRDLIEPLKKNFPTATIHAADALTFDFAALARDKKIRLVGNLPYNISTPLLFHVLDVADRVQDMLFMLQKEVVERLAAGPGGKDYGRLSVMVQWRCHVEMLFEVPPQAFMPAPEVDSAVVRLTPKPHPPTVDDFQLFEALVRQAFGHRRKMLRQSLKSFGGEALLLEAGLPPTERAENIAVADWLKLAGIAGARRSVAAAPTP